MKVPSHFSPQGVGSGKNLTVVMCVRLLCGGQPGQVPWSRAWLLFLVVSWFPTASCCSAAQRGMVAGVGCCRVKWGPHLVLGPEYRIHFGGSKTVGWPMGYSLEGWPFSLLVVMGVKARHGTE